MIAAARTTLRFTTSNSGDKNDDKYCRPRSKSQVEISSASISRSLYQCPDIDVRAHVVDSNRLEVPDNDHIRSRSSSVPLLRVTLANSLRLKPNQVRALKLTWRRLCETPRSSCKGILLIVERAFEQFESKNKCVRPLFYKTAFIDSLNVDRRRRGNRNGGVSPCLESIATLHDHASFFVHLFSQIIDNIDSDPIDIFEYIDKIGECHSELSQYGFKSSLWDRFGECFIDVIVVQDCVRAYPDAGRSWTILTAAVIDRLKAAYHRRHFTNNNNIN